PVRISETAFSSSPSCASRSCAVRSVSPISVGTAAARAPHLNQTRALRARGATEPGGGSCATIWPAATFGSGRRISSTRKVNPRLVAVAVASLVVRLIKFGTVTSPAFNVKRIDATANSAYVAISAPITRTIFPALQTRVLMAMNRLDRITTLLPRLPGSPRCESTDLLAGSNEHRTKERFESMDVRIGTKMSCCIDDGIRDRGTEGTRMERCEMRGGRQEPGGDRLVFIGLTRAGRINQPPTDGDSRRCTTEHRQLRRSQNGQFFLAPAPLDVRISTQRPQARAGSIDEDTIERIAQGNPLNQVRPDKLPS